MSVNLACRTGHVSSALRDKDGNNYTTVTIGTQEWIVENFKTTTYADGSAIPNITVDATWVSDSTGAYCWYENDSTTYADYGILYNWNAVNHASGLTYLERNGVEESGWRVPTRTDFQTLSTSIGGDVTGGYKLLEVGTTHWSLDTGHTNETGFTAVGAGNRSWYYGTFDYIMSNNFLWSSTQVDATYSYSRLLQNSSGQFLEEDYREKNWGLSVRLVRDVV